MTVKALAREPQAKGRPAIERTLGQLEREIPEVVRIANRPKRWAYKVATPSGPAQFRVLGLRLARAMLSFLRDSAIDAALEDLLRVQSPSDSGSLDLSRIFFAKTRMLLPDSIGVDIVDRILAEIIKGRVVKLSYFHFEGGHDEVLLEPYSFVFADAGLYCYGRVRSAQKSDHIDRCRLYNVTRIDKVTRTEDHFEYPPRDAFDPQSVFEHCFGIFIPKEDQGPEDVVLNFAPHWNSYLNRHKYHASQTDPVITTDGRVQIQFHVYVTHDFIQWVRGLGSEVEVVRPTHLRDSVVSRPPERDTQTGARTKRQPPAS